MSSQSNDQEISDKSTIINETSCSAEEQKNTPNTENNDAISMRIKTSTGFYQQKTYTLPSTNEQRTYKSSITTHEKPDTLQDMMADFEDPSLTEKDRIYRESFASIIRLNNNLVDKDISKDFESFVMELSEYHCSNTKEWRKCISSLLKKSKALGHPKKAAMRRVYMNLLRLKKVSKNEDLEDYLIAKASRTQSGVMVVTVLTSPYPRVDDKFQKFSCKHNCYYCPNEANMPRSYLSDEPAVQRGWKHHWSAIEQFYARLWTYYLNGHKVDKIELLVLGGTWSEYPQQYQETFIRDCFYAANTFYLYMELSAMIETSKEKIIRKSIRCKKSLVEEQKMNENALCRIIGITLETRPDSIDGNELKRLRNYGCTRVQIGIQHTNDKILKHINRGCDNEDAIRCVKLLKNVGFKLDFHLMPDLPGSSVALDEEMFYYVLNSTLIQADQWKIYPCQTTKYTVIRSWFEEGKYVPFKPQELLDLLIKVKCHVHPWIRLNRVIRDIPNQYIIGGNQITNLRQFLEKHMAQYGAKCACIRCREIRTKKIDQSNRVILKIRSFESSGGIEYFISYETVNEEIIFGFVRLRICSDFEVVKDIFPELVGCAMIRELHVYGQMIPVFDKKKSTQHKGFGKKLMNAAEQIAVTNGFKKLSVIAGVGTRNYYRKIGYKLKGTYMIKQLRNVDYWKHRLCYQLKLLKTQVPYQEMVQQLKDKTNYDCSLVKSKQVKHALVVKHYQIRSRLYILLYLSVVVVAVLAYLLRFKMSF
eukprot:135481_1